MGVGGVSKSGGAGSVGNNGGVKSNNSKPSDKSGAKHSASKNSKIGEYKMSASTMKNKLTSKLNATNTVNTAKISKTKYDPKQLVNNPKIKAFLNTIGYAEGANYNTIVKGTVVSSKTDKSLVGKKNATFSDFSKHPETLVKVNSKGLKSTAAGKYQIMADTWNTTIDKKGVKHIGLKDRLGLTDFSPKSQDLAAVQKMIDKGMVDSILKGDIKTAINLGSGTWASLPNTNGVGNYKDQNAKSLNDLQNVYKDSLSDIMRENRGI